MKVGALSVAGRTRELLVAVVSEGRRRKASPKRGSRGAGGGVDGPGVLRDERGGGVEQGFGSAPDHVKGLVPS